MSSITGNLIMYLYVGVLGALAALIGRTYFNKMSQRKGALGALVVFYTLGLLMLIFDSEVAIALDVNINEVHFIAILTFIIPTVLILWWNRKRIESTYEFGKKTKKRTVATSKKIKSKIGGK